MYITSLDAESAQKIADRIMQIIPYNINIMDYDGIIIASGDENRIGTIHQGAVKAIEMKKPYVVYKDTETERKGINLPIFYSKNIVGVIGISGDVEAVMQIGQIVVITAQLMIENQIFSEMTSIRESRLKDFLYEWISVQKPKYTGEFLDTANYLGIDLHMQRTAVIINCKRIRYSLFENIKRFLRKGEYLVRQRMEDALILFDSETDLDERLGKILALSKEITGCYVGEPSTVAGKTTRTAEQTFAMAKATGNTKRILHYSEVSLECILANIEEIKEVRRMMDILKEKDVDGILRETVRAYVEWNQDYAVVCEQLHIHRNTLNYRLSRIEELLDRNPRCARDLMYIYIAIVKMNM